MLRVAGAAIAMLAASWAVADEASVREGLAAGCLAGLPDFDSVAGTLAARGWVVMAGASASEIEARKAGVTVFVHTGDRSNAPGCTVMSDDVAVPVAAAVLEEQLERGFAGRWKSAPGYGGSKSWMVPGEGASLVMYVLGGGNSGEGPGSGISLSVRKDK